MREMGNAGHLNFDRHGDLALDLFSRAARPLGDDLHVVVGYVGVGLDGQRAEADDAPGGEHNDRAEDQPAALEREIDECANHLVRSSSLCASFSFMRGGFFLRKKPLDCYGSDLLQLADLTTGSPRFRVRVRCRRPAGRAECRRGSPGGCRRASCRREPRCA